MRYFGVIVCLAVIGCGQPVTEPPADTPVAVIESVDFVKTVDVPPDKRQGNWGPSCAIASSCMILQAHGLPETAAAWRVSYYGPSGIADLKARAVESRLGFASTTSGDATFLDWCNETNRKAGVWWLLPGGLHCVVFHGFTADGTRAYMVDPNSATVMRSVEKTAFIQWWQQSGGSAFTLYAYESAPPEPVKWEGSQNYEKASISEPRTVAVRRTGPLARFVQGVRERRASRRVR